MKTFDLKPEWLLYLHKVAETGSLRRAAQDLFMTEHSLRYNLKALEKFLQTSLLETGPQGLELTERGQALLADGMRLWERLKCLEERLEDMANSRMELRLGLSQAFPSERVKNILSLVQHQAPKLQVLLNVHTPRELEKRMSFAEYELGLTTSVSPNTSFQCLKGPAWPGVYVCKSSAVPQEYFVPPPWPFWGTEPMEYPATLSPYRMRYIGSMAIIRTLVLEGAGIGYLPLTNVWGDLAQGTLTQTQGPELPFQLEEFLLAKDFENLSPPAAYFVHYLKGNWQTKLPKLDRMSYSG